MDDSIGSVSVQIVADYSKLTEGFRAAQSQAVQAGAAIASAINAAVAPSANLTQATERLRQAEAALTSETAKHLASITPTSAAYANAQASLQQLNAQLAAAQAAFTQATAAANAQAQANQATAGAANQAATAFQNQAGAAMTLSQAVAALQQTIIQQSAAATLAAQRNAAMASSTTAVGSAASGTSSMMLGLYAAISVVRRAFSEGEEIRKSELELLHLSEATGISAQRFAEFQGAIERAGGEGDNFGKAVVFLSRSIEQGERGVKTMSDELKRLGVTSRDPIAAFLQIADTLHNTRDKSEALAAASRVLGRGEQELIGIMGQGSDALRQYMGQAEGLARARVEAIDSAVRLTAAEAEVKAALLEVATGALPVLVEAVKVVATAFSAVNIVVKLFSQLVMHSFVGAIQGAKDFGAVMSDLAHGRWELAKIDAGEMLANVRKQFVDMTHDMERETRESVSFIQKLWDGAAPKTTPGAGLAFPAPRPTGNGKGPENELRKQFQDELDDLKADHEVTIAEETAFWQERYDKVATMGAAYADLLHAIHNRLGTLNQDAIKKQAADIRKGEEEYIRQVETAIRAAQDAAVESGGKPAAVKLKMLIDTEAVSTGKVAEHFGAQIPAARQAAFKEDVALTRKTLAEEEAAWKESTTHTLQELIDFFELRKAMYANDAEIVKRSNEALAALRLRQTEQGRRVSGIQRQGGESDAETAIVQQKITLEKQYAEQAFHTAEQEIAYARQLGELDRQRLQSRVATAQAVLADALATKSPDQDVKVAEARLALLKAQNAVLLQQSENIAKVEELSHRASFGGLIDAGMARTAESAISKISSGIAEATTQAKGFGQVFHQILKQIEAQIVETFAGVALKKGLDFLLSASSAKPAGGGGAAAGGAAAGASTALVAALTTNAAATTAHSGIMATHLGVMITHTGTLIANTAAIIAHTIVVIAQTLATWALIAVEAIKAFFGFAKGGNPDPSRPFIAGENGPELIHPKGWDLTVIPASKTRDMLQAASNAYPTPAGSLRAPSVPDGVFGGGTQAAAMLAESKHTTNNHTVGDTVHNYNIYGDRNPRETMRQIADYQKRQTGKFSPANS